MPEGIIYITRTQQDEPNYYKVGRTTLSSTDQRTRHDQTYISGGIKTLREFKVIDDVAAERAAHESLLDVKVNLQHAKEIFKLDIDILIGRVKLAITPWLVGEKTNNENNWILDFLNQISLYAGTYPFSETNIIYTMKNLEELMMRSISEPKGLSINFRLEPDKDYDELIQDEKIGKYLQSALQHIDHFSLVKIDGWKEKFQIFMQLSIAPIFNPLSEDYNKKMYENRNKKLINGLKGFNINRVLSYWAENFFNSNPDLIIPILDFSLIELIDHRSFETDIFLKSAKLCLLNNAMKYCINHTDFKDDEINLKTNNYITQFLGGHLVLQDYPEVFSRDFIESFMQSNHNRYERNNRDR